MLRRIAALVCCLVLMLSLPLPAAAESDASRAVIQQMLNYYKHHLQAGKTDVFRLLEQLRQTDPESAELWENIFRHWYYALEEMPKNETVLPDTLPQDDSLCIVVLGYELEYNGSMKPELLGRLGLALTAAQQYPNAAIVCTGGGTAYGAKGTTEAGQMTSWLKEQGVDVQRLHAEKRSFSTMDNANYTLSLLAQKLPQVRQIVIVTSDYHLTRSTTLFHAAAVRNARDTGTDAITVAACLGYEAGHEGVAEDPLDQTAQVARIMGFQFQESDPPVLSVLTGIRVTGDTVVAVGQQPQLTVYADYDTGFSQEVTAQSTVTGYDAASTQPQQIRISYRENGQLISTALEIQRPEPETEPSTVLSGQDVEELLPEVFQELFPEENAQEENRPHPALLPGLILATALAMIILILVLRRPKPRKRRGKYAR